MSKRLHFQYSRSYFKVVPHFLAYQKGETITKCKLKYTFVGIWMKEHRYIEDYTYLCESGLVRTATFTEVLISTAARDSKLGTESALATSSGSSPAFLFAQHWDGCGAQSMVRHYFISLATQTQWLARDHRPLQMTFEWRNNCVSSKVKGIIWLAQRACRTS